MKNQHLNIFRFFNESSTNEAIENNLSRVLAIILQNNTLFFNNFVKSIVSNDDYEYLFSYWERQKHNQEGEEVLIDIQVSDGNIDKEQYKTVYPVAITTNQKMDLDNFFQLQNSKDNNIRDIVLSIKDILIVMEVKRTDENCKEQLFNQIAMFIPNPNEDNRGSSTTVEKPQNLSWQMIIKILEKTGNALRGFSKNDVFINDFLELLLVHYPNWFDTKPFARLPNNSPIEFFQNRLLEALNTLKEVHGYTITPEGWRIRVGIPMKWAGEVVLVFDNAKNSFEFQVYPGNTKEQGKSMFAKSLDWTKQTSLQVKNHKFSMYVEHHVKFCHFNSYVTAINYPIDTKLKDVLYKSENLWNISGKWNKPQWKNFEATMDDYFDSEILDWREECHWEDNFVNTGRSYFTLSLGYSVSIYTDYPLIQSIDKTDDATNLANFLQDIFEAIKRLI